MNCEICCEAVENICHLQCTHSLCQNCLIGIKNSVAAKSSKPKCPWCRHNICADVFKLYDTKHSHDPLYNSPFLLLDEAQADAVIERMIQHEYGTFDLDRIYIPRNRHRHVEIQWVPSRTRRNRRRRRYINRRRYETDITIRSNINPDNSPVNPPPENSPTSVDMVSQVLSDKLIKNVNKHNNLRTEGKKSKWSIKESVIRSVRRHR